MAAEAQHITAKAPPAHEELISLWKRTAGRLKNRSKRIVMCRQFRRGLLRVPIPKEWNADNPDIREWMSVCLPERQLLDLNLTNVLGERSPELSRVPLGTTNQAIEDADRLEVWSQSAYDAAADEDAVIGLLVQDGEFAAIVSPSRAGPEEPPEYTVEVEAKRGLKVRKPDPIYDRDAKGKAPGTREYDGKRDEKRSREAYDEARLRWLAEHPLWNVELVSATDCAPLMVRGKGRERWECKGLIVRTLFDREELLYEGFSWKGMEDDLLIPLDFDAERVQGNGGQLYLYRAYLMIRDPKTRTERPIIVYSVGGAETWTEGDDGERKAAVIDCEKEYGLKDRFWGYFYGLHFEDDPDFRGQPFIAPLLSVMMSHEATRAAIRAAMWDVSFTGHVEVPDPNLPPELVVEGFKQATTPKPPPGKTVKALGRVTPYQQATVGADAYRMMELDRRDLDVNSPDSATVGGGDAAGRSGNALAIGEQLLRSGKRQIGRAVLHFAEFVSSRQLMIACAAMNGAGGQPKVDVPVFVTEEEQLDDGTVQEKTSVLALDERWVGGQYRMKATFPEEGNLAEVEQMASLAERGFATDEDVDKARGIKNTTLSKIKRAIYQRRKSPQGQMELELRAAQYQGDQQRIKLLQLVAQQKATPGGGPMAAIDPSMPGTAAMGGMGMGMGMPPGGQTANGGMPGQGGPTEAQQSRAGTIGGQMGTARAVAGVGQGAA
jgi:hypothetical protein